MDDSGWGYWSQQGQLSGWIDTPRTIAFTGLRPCHLGRHHEAVPLFEEALAGTVAPIRRAFTRTDLAFSWGELGEPERASAAGIAALDEVKGLDLVKDHLRTISGGWDADWHSLECVRQLDERLATA